MVGPTGWRRATPTYGGTSSCAYGITSSKEPSRTTAPSASLTTTWRTSFWARVPIPTSLTMTTHAPRHLRPDAPGRGQARGGSPRNRRGGPAPRRTRPHDRHPRRLAFHRRTPLPRAPRHAAATLPGTTRLLCTPTRPIQGAQPHPTRARGPTRTPNRTPK
jgi:hypothetical protein